MLEMTIQQREDFHCANCTKSLLYTKFLMQHSHVKETVVFNARLTHYVALDSYTEPDPANTTSWLCGYCLHPLSDEAIAIITDFFHLP